MAGADDVDIYDLASKQQRIIVTINRDDFEHFVGTRDDRGAISVPDGHNVARADGKLTSLLMRHGPKYFKGRLIALGGKQAA